MFTRAILCLILEFAILAPAIAVAADDAPNTLTVKERSDGWKLLFDGKTTAGWRGYNRKDMPAGWKVIDGALVRTKGGAGGKGAGGGDDIITVDPYDNFELKLEWRIVAGGNSGVLFRVKEGAVTSWHVAPEMQVLDNGPWKSRSKAQLAGSLYDLYPAAKDVTKPVKDWNQAGVVANGPHIQHWLNGEKMCEYEIGSADWKERIAKSKFKDMKGFATATKGYICLQDHSDRVEFRSIKLKVLVDKGSR